ncbi:MAG: glycosyltransferase, partial [Clostridium sp.]|nr:glycosyltransferase [Clostridium sp.]
MKIFLKKSLLTLFLLNLVFIPLKANALENNNFGEVVETKSKCNLKFKERQLWIEHVLWTRNFIVSDIASLDDKAPVLERLLKNQDDIGNSIKP